jgi:Ca2+-binding RTX toxin-like protein
VGCITNTSGYDFRKGQDAGDDILNGGANNDILNGGLGVDALNGGLGFDSFVFAAGDTAQSDANEDSISGFEKGAVGAGDEIDYQSALTIGGSDAAATSSQASINATTGVATFGPSSPASFGDALADIAARFTASTDAAGEFALFQFGGNFHLFISDGTAGVGANDVVVELVGVTTIGSIDVGLGDLTILT